MSKLFQLKEWLNIAEAARHLSTVFREQATEADVLRLALDGHLTLSVYFVNRAQARRGRIVPIENAQLREVPADLATTLNLNGANPLKTIEGIKIDNSRVLELEPEIVRLDGVYDLPMIGGEELDVENEYQRLTGGPEVTLSNLEGAFVQQDDVTLFQLQESFDQNEYQRGSRAALELLERRIATGELDRVEADRLLKTHAEDRKDFLAKSKRRPPDEGYYPAGGLPPDAVLVARTKALRQLQERVESYGKDGEGKLGPRAETTYRNIIGGLLRLMLGQTPSGKPQSVYTDQTAIIDALLATHGKKPGISQRTLEDKFAAAKRSLDGS